MADIKRIGSVNPGEIVVPDGVAEFIRKIVTRREFLQVSGAVGLGVATFNLIGCGSSSTADATPRQVFVANAQGMIVAEPSRCVGCRRCELACSEYNDGKSMPSISRIKSAGTSTSARPVQRWGSPGRKASGGTIASCRTSATSARTRCPASWPALTAPSRSCPRSTPGSYVEQMRRLRHLREGLPVGDDIPERAGRWRDTKATKCTPLQAVRPRSVRRGR